MSVTFCLIYPSVSLSKSDLSFPSAWATRKKEKEKDLDL